VGKHPTSHRYNLLPLLRSSPGGIQKEHVVQDLPDDKSSTFELISKTFIRYFFRKSPTVFIFRNLLQNIFFKKNNSINNRPVYLPNKPNKYIFLLKNNDFIHQICGTNFVN